MRADLARAVKGYFIAEMQRLWPFFDEVKAREVVSSGNRLFRWKQTADYFCFVLLQFHRRVDAFTVSIARTKDFNFGTFDEDIALAKESPNLRIQKLWGEPKDFWILLNEEKEMFLTGPLTAEDRRNAVDRMHRASAKAELEANVKLARDSVDFAIGLIEKHAIPFFVSGAEMNKLKSES